MIFETEEGLKILKGPDGSKALFIDSSRIDECISYLYEHELKHISINPFQGYELKNLQFLARVEDYLEGISILEDFYDYEPLNRLHKLQSLGFLDNKKDSVDLANFPELKSLSCDYSSRLLSLESCQQLKQLTLTGFKSSDNTLKELPKLSSLRTLNLCESSITSLDGIGKFLSLQEVTLYKLTRLQDISALPNIKDTLRKLEFDSCKRIRDYSHLAALTHLVRLKISNAGAIPSLSFIELLPSLEFLSFIGTNVVDGDLSPTIELDYVGFENKRHYSHTFEEIMGNL